MSRNNKYLELIGELENKMFGMAENSLLPPEQQLADKFGVSKPTLRRALQLMVESGQLRKLNGIGVAVAKCPASISRELIFLCHDIEFFAETLKHFGILALDAHYFISIIPLSGDALTQERIILSTLERRPAGVVIYADPHHNDLAAFHRFAALNIPVLHLMRLPRGINGNLLEFDNSDGITEIVKIFYRKGCRRIALYADMNINPAAAEERENGFKTGMEKCRLKIRPEYYCSHKSSKTAREKFFKLFSNAKTRPDAVCCLNDFCAGTLTKELTKRKVNVDNICFSGFDHSPLSEFIPQPLLTVDPPMAEMGKKAAKLLIRQVENPHFGFQRKKLHSKIISIK